MLKKIIPTKFAKSQLIFMFLLVGFLFTNFEIPVALAQITNPAIGELGGNASNSAGYDPDSGSIEQAYSGGTVLAQFVRLWNNAMSIGAILVVGYFIWGAIEWILSEGDKGKLEKARQKMTNAVVGIVLVSATVSIFMLIQNILNICILDFGGDICGSLSSSVSEGI